MQKTKLALGMGIAASLLLSCAKTDLGSKEFNRVEALGSASQTSASTKSYLILCRSEAVSETLLARIQALGNVSASLKEIGVVLASSANPNFKVEIEKLSEVQKVMPDLKLNWLKETVDQNRAVALPEQDLANDAVEPNAIEGLIGTNRFVPLQWSLGSVQAQEAFKAGYKGKGALVAVLDGGFHPQHPDLAANILADKTISFVENEAAQMKNPLQTSHGSHVAGIIAAADNNVGMVGIAPSASLMLVKVLGDNGRGQFGWIIQGVMYAADKGADIINMSLGATLPRNGKFIDDGDTPDDPSDDVVINEAKEIQELIIAMNRAMQYARKKGALPIVSAGNNSTYVTGQGQGTNYPANCSGVVTIAANSPNGWAVNPSTSLFEPSSFTNTGRSLVTLAGPGGDFDHPGKQPAVVGGIAQPAWVFDMVFSVGSSNSYTWMAGTSMSCPAASGVAALIAGKYHGNISPAQLEAKLKASAVDLGALGADAFYGNGQVNAANAIRQ